MKEIKDIAMWEETDSELAKLNIMQLLSDNKILTRKFKKVMKQIIEQDKRIDKAIEYIETSNNNPQPFYKYIFGDENGKVQNLDKLLNILRGEDNDSKRNV